MARVNLVDQGGWNPWLKKACHSVMDAAGPAARELDKRVWHLAATRQPDLEATLHERTDGLTADEPRSSGNEDASSHGMEPETT
jgi:hypothetical protein